jgi:hypothetical protein
MKYKFIYFLALFLLMLTTGVFLGNMVYSYSFNRLFFSEEFIHIGQVIILNVALPMRFILPLTLLFMLLSLWFYADKKSTGFYMGIISSGLIILVLLITLLILVPIDNSIKTWTAETIPLIFQTFVRDGVAFTPCVQWIRWLALLALHGLFSPPRDICR